MNKSVVPNAVARRKGSEPVDSKQFDELVTRLASTSTRRDAVKGVLGGTLAGVGVVSVTSAKNTGKKAKKPKKAKKCQSKPKVCFIHKGQTIEVSGCAAKAHRKHGDTQVPCPYG